MRHEWVDPVTSVLWAADDDTGLPISKTTTLAFKISDGWMPDGGAEAAREILRLAAERTRILAAERTRIRRELLEALHAWAVGAHPSTHPGAVKADLRAALDRICPEEG